jgi:hypothetical protein
MAAVDFLDFSVQALAGDACLEVLREESVVLAGQHLDRDVRPGLEAALFGEDDLCFRTLVMLAFAHDVSRHIVQKVRGQIEFGAVAMAAVSPGSGIIALTKTSMLTACRAQTSGAVKPPSDCATRITPPCPSIARTTRSAYASSPACSSSPGKSTAIASWPASRSNGTTRCQYHAMPPAPGIRTKHAMAERCHGCTRPSILSASTEASSRFVFLSRVPPELTLAVMTGAVIRGVLPGCVVLLVTACGGDAAKKETVTSGTLDVAADASATAGCATLDGASWKAGSTGFDELRQATNQRCALLPVTVDGVVYWITSTAFEGTVGSDDLRHSFDTAEAAVKVGNAPLELSAAGADGGAGFKGTVTVQKVTSSSVEFSIE